MSLTNKPTELLYLNDTLLFEYEGSKILQFSKNASEGLSELALDKTIFYPQGGGQPTDVGWISNSAFSFEVISVAFDNGFVIHKGYLKEGEIRVGDLVKLSVNSEVRMLNARNHTAGHALTVAVERLYPELVGVKGYHFNDGPYVEFEGSASNFDIKSVEDVVAEIVNSRMDIPTQIVTKAQLNGMCKHVPATLPIGKPIRVMIIDGEAIPCGGTHLPNTSYIGNFIIRKVKQKGGRTKVSYT